MSMYFIILSSIIKLKKIFNFSICVTNKTTQFLFLLVSMFSTAAKKTEFRIKSGLKFTFCYFLPAWPLVRNLTTLSINFFTHKRSIPMFSGSV